MRGNTRSRPVSQHGAPSIGPAMPLLAPRKIFNCIIDDTALVAGVKRSTRNGIRQWVKNGQIRLFVPLHALEQLSIQKAANTRHGEDVRETLQWLDDATTKYPHAVTLQGGDQYYQDWSEVERFTVPRTLFSENDHLTAVDDEPTADDLPQMTASLTVSDHPARSPASSAASVGSASTSTSPAQSARSSVSQLSPPTSPAKQTSSPAKPATASYASTSMSAIVPRQLQSLFNYILWRIHQELDPIAALESFIFLCNDPTKVHYAKGFDIKCKRLEQLREAIGREERDFRNRQSLYNRENQQAAAQTPAGASKKLDEEDEVVYKPPPRAAPVATAPMPNVIDPNVFGRTSAAEPLIAPKSPRVSHHQTYQAQPARGNMNPTFHNRGAVRGNFRGGRGRGNFSPGRGGFITSPGRVNDGQIDPDSFARPRGGFPGPGRKLWVPT